MDFHITYQGFFLFQILIELFKIWFASIFFSYYLIEIFNVINICKISQKKKRGKIKL